jgi:hypothetical protein
MDEQLLQKFLFEIARRCEFCLLAFEDLNQALLLLRTAGPDQRSRQQHMERLWYSVQSFLVASGNISKLLFGSSNQHDQLRAELRRSLGIDDSSPFHFRNRETRNYFEHFDINSSTRHNFVDSNVGPRNMFGGRDEHDFIRNFDPENMTITFYGEEYSILPIVEAAKQLRERVKIEAENNWYIPHLRYVKSCVKLPSLAEPEMELA